MADRMVSLFRLTLKCYDCGLRLKELKNSFTYLKWRRLMAKNEMLKDYKHSDICYICGNGPSLKKVNLDEIVGDTIVMNDHWRVGANYDMTPTFYLVADDIYAQPSWKERYEHLMKYRPEIPHIFTVKMGPKLDEYQGENNIFYFSPLSSTYKCGKNNDFTKNVPNAFNVVSWAILLAIYLGYKEIYLLGCDYSLFASRYITHAYDKNGEKIKCPTSLRDMLFKYSIATHIHYEIQKYADTQNVKIVNLTKDTVLDAYEVDENSKY